MKKYGPFMLAFLLCAAMLTACGTGTSPPSIEESSRTVSTNGGTYESSSGKNENFTGTPEIMEEE